MATRTATSSDTLLNSTNPYNTVVKALRRRPKLSLDAVQNVITQAILQKTVKDTDILRKVFRMFGRPKDGITPEVFRHQLHVNFGIILSDEDAAELFGRYDKEGSGRIPLQRFVQRALPADYTASLWNVQRDEECDRAREANLQQKGLPVVDRLPKSLEKVKWNVDEIERHLQVKIVERTKRASDQYREAFALFGSPNDGISRSMFKHHLQKLGFVLTPEELNELFNRYDLDGSGRITFSELVSKVMPQDYTETPWNIKRDEETDAQTIKRKAQGLDMSVSWPASLKHNRMTISQIEAAIQQKIIERTKRASDQYREAFAMFGSPAHGITPSMFRHVLHNLGLVVSDEDIETLFRKYNTDGSGRIKFSELVSHVMPKDYTVKPWNIARDEECDRKAASSDSKYLPVAKQWPAAVPRWSLDQIEKAIQMKIIERTKRANDQFREAFALFGSPANGITPESFKFHLRNLGLIVSDADIKALFDKYNSDGSGRISFMDLVSHVMPPDYTEPAWNIKRDEENFAMEEAKREAFLQDAPFRRSMPRKAASHASLPAAATAARSGSAAGGRRKAPDVTSSLRLEGTLPPTHRDLRPSTSAVGLRRAAAPSSPIAVRGRPGH